MPDEAVNHLKIADNYLTHIADEIPDHPEVAKIQFLHTVEIATRHIQAARKLDLTAVYNHIDPKTKEVFPQSVEDMECRALFWEGYPTVEWSDNAYDIKKGIQALLKALNYGPYNAQVNKALGRAYLRLGDRVTADKYLKEVLKIEPDNFEVHKLLDGMTYLQPVEKRGGPPTFSEAFFSFIADHPVASLFMFSGVCLVLAFLFGLDSPMAPLFSIGWLLSAVLAIILWWNI